MASSSSVKTIHSDSRITVTFSVAFSIVSIQKNSSCVRSSSVHLYTLNFDSAMVEVLAHCCQTPLRPTSLRGVSRRYSCCERQSHPLQLRPSSPTRQQTPCKSIYSLPFYTPNLLRYSSSKFRIRHLGMSAFNIWTQRDQVCGTQLSIQYQQLIAQQVDSHKKNSTVVSGA